MSVVHVLINMQMVGNENKNNSQLRWDNLNFSIYWQLSKLWRNFWSTFLYFLTKTPICDGNFYRKWLVGISLSKFTLWSVRHNFWWTFPTDWTVYRKNFDRLTLHQTALRRILWKKMSVKIFLWWLFWLCYFGRERILTDFCNWICDGLSDQFCDGVVGRKKEPGPYGEQITID